MNKVYLFLMFVVLGCDFNLPEKKSLKNCQFPTQISITPDSNNRSKVSASLNNLNASDITSINWCYGVAQGTPCSTGFGGVVNGSESFALPSEGNYTISAIVTSVCGEKRTLSTNYSYTLPKPQFYSFSPTSGGWGDTIVLKGEQLDAKSVTINGAQAEVINSSDSQITIKVPERSGSGKIIISDNSGAISSTSSFQYIERYYVKEIMDFESGSISVEYVTNLIPREDGTVTAVIIDAPSSEPYRDFLTLDIEGKRIKNSQVLSNSKVGGYVRDFFEKDRLLYFSTDGYLRKITENGWVETIFDFKVNFPTSFSPNLSLGFDSVNETFLVIVPENYPLGTLFKLEMEGSLIKSGGKSFDYNYGSGITFNSSVVKGNELYLSYWDFKNNPIDKEGLLKLSLINGEVDFLVKSTNENQISNNRSLISIEDNLVFLQIRPDNGNDIMSYNTLTKELKVLNSGFGNGNQGVLEEEKFSSIEVIASIPNSKDFYLVERGGVGHVLNLIEFK